MGYFIYFPEIRLCFEKGRPVGLVRGLTADGFYTTDDFTYENGVYTLKKGVPDVTSAVFLTITCIVV